MRFLHFEKIHGAGNDFVIFDWRKAGNIELPELAKVICDRHFGVGADGIVALLDSAKADYKMAYFNADGSRAVCGNGIRCLARFLRLRDIIPSSKTELKLETDSGIVKVSLLEGGSLSTVAMGRPEFEGSRIPTAVSGEHVTEKLQLSDQSFLVTAVSMGNPHCVIFCEDLEKIDINKIGHEIEHHKFFPERTNVEFVKIINPDVLEFRIWERGVGETLASGTGACASLAASVKSKLSNSTAKIICRGGTFEAKIDSENNIFLTGPAEHVFSGEFDLKKCERRDLRAIEIASAQGVA